MRMRQDIEIILLIRQIEIIDFETAADPECTGFMQFDNFLQTLKNHFTSKDSNIKVELAKAFKLLNKNIDECDDDDQLDEINLSQERLIHYLQSFKSDYYHFDDESLKKFLSTISINENGNVLIDEIIDQWADWRF